MNYLQLPPKKLIALAQDLNEKFGLIVPERPAKVELDESKFGKGWEAGSKTYRFSMIEKDGNKSLITIQNGDGSVLYAVTKNQYKSWYKCNIVSELKRWNFERFIDYEAQYSHRNKLISLTKDLDGINRFLRKIFYKGENNGQEE